MQIYNIIYYYGTFHSYLLRCDDCREKYASAAVTVWLVCNKTGGDDVCIYSQVTEGRHRKLRCDRLIRRRQQQQQQKRDALPLMAMMCNANARLQPYLPLYKLSVVIAFAEILEEINSDDESG